jgi:NCAIR mutase (PurE)-related protein
MIIAPMHELTRIEPATIEDLSLLAELLMELFGQEPDFRPDYNNQMRGLRLILEQPSRGRIFVLRSANKIIGMINLLFTISTAEGGFVVLLEDLIVAKHFRGQGMGSELLKYAMEYAKQKSLLRITLLTDRKSEGSLAFFEKHGFQRSEGKSPDDLTKILETLVEKNGVALATRAKPNQYKKVIQALPDARFESVGRCIVIERKPLPRLPRKVAVVSAGTTDRPVIEEARVTLELFGNSVEIIQDVGVAGIHRTIAAQELIDPCSVVIVVAGMEGALPSVIAGLVSKPVIAVPTSVGYGASFGGIAALLGMLNSCASGVTVVNIDNGFGAAYAASLINREIGLPISGQ